MSILSQIAAGAAKRNNGGGSGGGRSGSGSWGATSDVPRPPSNLQRIGNGISNYFTQGTRDYRAANGGSIPPLGASLAERLFTPAPGSSMMQNLFGYQAPAGSRPAAPARTPFRIQGLPGSGIPLPAPPRPNPYDQYAGMLNVGFQGQVGNYDMALQRSQTGFGLRSAGYDGVENAVRQSLGTDIEGNNLNRMTTEVNRRSNIGDIQGINAQRRINEGMNATQLQELLTQERMVTDLYGQAGVTSNREQARAKQLEHDEMLRSISEQSANGATSTVAARRNAQLTGEATDDQIAQIKEGYTAEGTRFRASLEDIRTGRDKLNWDLQGSNLDLDTQARHLFERDSLLAIEAARHNVSERQLRNAANERLAQIGLDRAVSFGQLIEAQNSRDINVANAASQFIQNIAAYAAQNPG